MVDHRPTDNPLSITDNSLPITGKRGLYLFTHDLRLEDNPALNHLISQCESLLFVYLIDPKLTESSRHSFPRLGQHRRRFIWQSLRDLHQHLQRFGHQLHLIQGKPEKTLLALLEKHRINLIAGSFNSGLNETRFWQALQDQTVCQVITLHQNALFTPEHLPVAVDKIPKQFTPFRKLADELIMPEPVKLNPLLAQRKPMPEVETGVEPETASQWPESPPLLSDSQTEHQPAPQLDRSSYELPISGGSEVAWNHLDHFIWKSRAIDHYKQTRNTLDIVQQPDHVSLLSGWLAQGCLSARQVWREISQYEQQFGNNESSYWLKFELLWREFFYWNAHRLGVDLYCFAGERGKKPLTSFYAQRFKSWCEGNTAYPLVNACMKQLKATGMLSNRGRQIVASALVNELQLDWRYGAAWFEHQLIDYDPGSNYGNWQYIAGVGADPRGGRHFNLEKQASEFDPQGDFIRRWAGDDSGANTVTDAVGIDDWPLYPQD
ncbi:DASH family cryptochrome [Oceanospirillum sanctuarii]|uniref:DASH family cryptochrome n=1 Tax=Oceanospirillum sanctuarii TaxID=1434821 RepID=UPI000A35F624|nr:DASH family cryptochrome [Oceanospirillum sanctuarii]